MQERGRQKGKGIRFSFIYPLPLPSLAKHKHTRVRHLCFHSSTAGRRVVNYSRVLVSRDVISRYRMLARRLPPCRMRCILACAPAARIYADSQRNLFGYRQIPSRARNVNTSTRMKTIYCAIEEETNVKYVPRVLRVGHDREYVAIPRRGRSNRKFVIAILTRKVA